MRCLLVYAFAMLCAATLRAQTPSLLVISIDGMRPDYVTHADEHGMKLPTLRGLMRDGAYAEGVRGVFPTVTYPSHTTLMTGVWPAEHGIVNNQRFDPEHKMAGAWYWYADQIKVPTLWSAAHAAGLSTASVGWPVTVDAKDIDTLLPEYWRGNLGETDNPDDRWMMNAVSRPMNEVEAIGKRIGVPYMAGNETTLAGDEVKTKYSLEILRRARPAFMTIHLSSLDEEEHLHGPFSHEANDDLEALDGMVARLIAQARANDPGAFIAVVSDHGFADIDTALNLGSAFVKAGLMSASGKGAWKAQPWPLGCMYAIMLHDPVDASTRQQVKVLLDQIAADPANGVEAVLDPAQVAATGGAPEAAWVVTLRKGFTSAPANTPGGLVIPVPGHRGTHGYDPATTPEMRASFLIAGPGIGRGKNLGVVDMRSVAPTFASLLRVPFEQAKSPALDLH